MPNVIDNCNDINSSELLCQAAIKGDTNLLQELLKRDPLILQRPPPPPPSSSSASNLTTAVAVFPLNLACKYGHKEFVFQLLSRQPDLFEVVDPYDQASTPLHVACRNGHHEVVKYLVSVNPSACFLRDNQGRNPIHVAASRGHCEVLNELAKACPHAVRERTSCPTASGGVGDTVLHVCVKHNKLEALKLLVKTVGDTSMLNAGDANGNTILHIAVTNTEQQETVRYLLDNKNTNINTLNAAGFTPKDVYSQQDHKDIQLKCLLKRVNALRSVDVPSNNLTYSGSWFENKRNTLMVVASLLSTMAFQAGINPPGGVCQDDSPLSPTDDSRKHTAGFSIMASRLSSHYNYFLICNTIGLASSMCCILILISGLPFKKFTAVVVMVTMWIALGFMMAAYFNSLMALTPPRDLNFIEKLSYMMSMWWILFTLTILGHFIRVIVKLVKKLPRLGRSYWLKEGDEQTGQRGAP